jgi:hypothetical protein
LLWDDGGPKERARAAICCRKSEIEVSLPHEQSVLFGMAHGGPPFQRRFRYDKSARKNYPLKISCNPLISIDSDERIQGNPRKSNPQNLGFCSQTATFQENPNRVDERRCARCREGAKPDSIQMHSGLTVSERSTGSHCQPERPSSRLNAKISPEKGVHVLFRDRPAEQVALRL